MYRRKRQISSQPETRDQTQPEQLQPHQPVFFTMSSVYDEPSDYDELTDLDQDSTVTYDHPDTVSADPATPKPYQDLYQSTSSDTNVMPAGSDTSSHYQRLDDVIITNL